MKPLDVSCRHTDPDGTNCPAQSGEPCQWLSVYGNRYKGQTCHAERIADAAAMSGNTADPKLVHEAFSAVLEDIV